jgi:predicted nucleic acid-binding protein
MSSSAYVEKVGRLVVDANIALGAILSGSSGNTRRLMRRLAAMGIALVAPQELIHEVETHFAKALARSLHRRNVTGAEFDQAQHEAAEVWDELRSSLRFVPSHEYRFFESSARRRLPADPDDWPYVALALRLDCGIITKNLAHFAQSGIPIWSLETAALLLED